MVIVEIVVAFLVGLVSGGALVVTQNPTVEKAITAIKSAEADAQATIAKITAHKAS